MQRPRLRPLILLIEDSDDDAFFFERLLKKSGMEYDLIRHENGSRALQYLAQFSRSTAGVPRPDLVFLDLKLPGANGFEILQWMLEQKFSPGFNVSVLSGSDQPEDVRRASRLGATDYLVKPILPDQLQSRLQAWAAPQREAIVEQRSAS